MIDFRYTGVIMKHRVTRIACTLTAASLVLLACGNSGDDTDKKPTDSSPSQSTTPVGGDRNKFVSITGVPGVSDKEIKVASISIQTNNPLGTNVGGAYNEGVEAYLEWRNDEGGIYGRQLVLDEKLDDALVKNKDQATAVCAGKKTFATFVAPLLFTGAETLNNCGMPTFGWAIHAEFAGKKYLFGHLPPTCRECVTPILPYIAKTLGVTKVGVLGYGTSENSKGCAATQKASFEKFAASTGGIEVVYFDNSLPFGLPSGIAPQVSKLKEKGAQFVSTCIDLNGMKKLGDELKKQGMDDVVLYHPNTYNAAFVKANAAIFEGDIVVPSFVPFEAKIESELQAKFFEYTDKTGVKREELTMIGWLNANLLFEGLLAAGPEFDQTAVVDAIRAMPKYTADGLIPPVEWGRQLDGPTVADPVTSGPKETCFTAVQVKDGAFVQWSGESGKPWLCWPNPQDTYAEPTAESFSN